MKRMLTTTALVAAVLFSLRASAQSLFEPGDRTANKNEVSVGTGVLSYFSGSAGGSSGTWDLRYGRRIIPLLTLEGGYTGALGDSPGAGGTVVTILEGDAKFNPLRNSRLNPYALAGIGWGAFTGFNGTRSDNGTLQFPIGGGLDYRITDKLDAGGRFVFHAAADDNIGNLHARSDSWALTARVGSTF